MEELKNKIEQIFAHIQNAKEELEQMNVGKAHEELIEAIKLGVFHFDDDGLEMNDTVTCTLTDKGAAIINMRHEDMKRVHPQGDYKTDYKEGDEFSGTLWYIISLLPAFHMGQDVYIKNIKKK